MQETCLNDPTGVIQQGLWQARFFVNRISSQGKRRLYVSQAFFRKFIEPGSPIRSKGPLVTGFRAGRALWAAAWLHQISCLQILVRDFL